MRPRLILPRTYVSPRRSTLQHSGLCQSHAAPWGIVSYIKQRSCQRIVLGLLLTAFLLSQFPGLDIQISRLFYDDGFLLKVQWWQSCLHSGMRVFLWLSMGWVVWILPVEQAIESETSSELDREK